MKPGVNWRGILWSLVIAIPLWMLLCLCLAAAAGLAK